MNNTMWMWRFATIGLVTLALVSCSSQPSAGGAAEENAAAATEQATAPVAEQELLEDVVVANRILTREVGILDVLAHVSVRSKANPNHWYMARFVAPGGATVSDMIEYDFESTPVKGPRQDNARETYLHGQIFKARPDVMAVVHAHTPEFVAFSMQTVPLYWGPNRALPVWDVRLDNDGRTAVVANNPLGEAMAKKLGNNEAVLLWGHGIALTGKSLPELIHRIIALRENARLQMAAIDIGSSAKPEAIVDDPAADQAAWNHYKRLDLRAENGKVPMNPAPMPARPSDPTGAAKHDLVLANRILSGEDVAVLGTAGHVSIRNPSNPNSYFVATTAPGSVTEKDIIERDITKGGPDTLGLSIDDEIYKANPNIGSVLYAQTPEVVPFTRDVKLRRVTITSAVVGEGLPVFNLSTLDPGQPLLSNPALGKGVAAALGQRQAVLLSGNGVVVTGRTIYNVTTTSYQLRHNARTQRLAMGLPGQISYFANLPGAGSGEGGAATANAAPPPRGNGNIPNGQLGPPEGREWVYWAQTTPVD